MGDPTGAGGYAGAVPKIDIETHKMEVETVRNQIQSLNSTLSMYAEGTPERVSIESEISMLEGKRDSLDEMIEGPELGGAATWVELATQSEINLFI